MPLDRGYSEEKGLAGLEMSLVRPEASRVHDGPGPMVPVGRP